LGLTAKSQIIITQEIFNSGQRFEILVYPFQAKIMYLAIVNNKKFLTDFPHSNMGKNVKIPTVIDYYSAEMGKNYHKFRPILFTKILHFSINQNNTIKGESKTYLEGGFSAWHSHSHSLLIVSLSLIAFLLIGRLATTHR
jgi:hypothetical protein